MKRLITALLLCLTPWAWADGVDNATVKAYIEFQASEINEAHTFGVLFTSNLDPAFHAALVAAGDEDGSTFRFTTADGVTEVALDVISYDDATGLGCIAFSTPGSSASTNTGFWVYGGSPTATMYARDATYGGEAVWSDYSAMYTPGMPLKNRIGPALTAYNSPGTAASGLEGILAATFNGSTSHYRTSAAPEDDWPITLETYGYSNNTTTNQNVAALRLTSDSQPTHANTMRGDFADNHFSPAVRGKEAGFATRYPSSFGYSTGVEYYQVTSRSAATSGTTASYIDGAYSNGVTNSLTGPPDFDIFTIGGTYQSSLGAPLSGGVIFTAISGSVRSANHVATMQNIWRSATILDVAASVALGDDDGPTVQDRTRGFFLIK